MPELPDLEVFAKNLTKQLKAHKLVKVTAVVTKKLNASKRELEDALEGHTLTAIERNGKELFFHFGKPTLSLHLMLNGGLLISKSGEMPKHAILTMEFDNGKQLTLTDWQGAAAAKLNPPLSDVPDALSDKITTAYLQTVLNSKRAVKTVLLDQKVIRGIGNAYADEILWEAGISPFSISNKIPDEYVPKLDKTIKKVLKHAVKQIEKHDPDIISGEVRDFLDIHNAKKTESPTGAKILQKTLSSRKTYYTEEQILFE